MSSHYNLKYISFIPINYLYSSTQSPSTLIHLYQIRKKFKGSFVVTTRATVLHIFMNSHFHFLITGESATSLALPR